MTDYDPKSFDLNGCKVSPRALISWKNTDASGEFYCSCGTQSGWGGGYCNYVRCTKCGTIYEMPGNLFPRPVTSTDCGIEPVDMEPTRTA